MLMGSPRLVLVMAPCPISSPPCIAASRMMSKTFPTDSLPFFAKTSITFGMYLFARIACAVLDIPRSRRFFSSVSMAARRASFLPIRSFASLYVAPPSVPASDIPDRRAVPTAAPSPRAALAAISGSLRRNMLGTDRTTPWASELRVPRGSACARFTSAVSASLSKNPPIRASSPPKSFSCTCLGSTPWSFIPSNLEKSVCTCGLSCATRSPPVMAFSSRARVSGDISAISLREYPWYWRYLTWPGSPKSPASTPSCMSCSYFHLSAYCLGVSTSTLAERDLNRVGSLMLLISMRSSLVVS